MPRDTKGQKSATTHDLIENVGGVSFANQFWYDPRVVFKHEYEDILNAKPSGVSGASSGAAGQQWSGREVRDGLASADRQRQEADQQQPDAQSGDLLGGPSRVAEDVNGFPR